MCANLESSNSENESGLDSGEDSEDSTGSLEFGNLKISGLEIGDSSKRGRDRLKKATKEAILPPIPNFELMQHKKPSSDHPDHLLKVPALDVFHQFFLDSILKTITINTNHYAAIKEIEEGSRRAWEPLTIPKLLIFIAICIYFGIVYTSGSLE